MSVTKFIFFHVHQFAQYMEERRQRDEKKKQGLPVSGPEPTPPAYNRSQLVKSVAKPKTTAKATLEPQKKKVKK